MSRLRISRTVSATVIRRHRWSSPAVMTRFIASYTGAIRSNIRLTLSADNVPASNLTNGLGDRDPPPPLVEPGCHDTVHRVVHRRDPIEHPPHAVGRQCPGFEAHERSRRP